MIKSLLKAVFQDLHLTEGIYADQYTNSQLQQQIRDRYISVHTPKKNPLTNPLDYDPLAPPEGWRYDPFYEIWLNIEEK
jgi:hypothetical protein